MPYTVSCSSRCRPGFCQVLWTTNRGSTFVKNDKDYTITSTPPYIDMQSHQLIVHTANSSTDYQCKLVSVTGRIIDSAEQYVDVKEPAAGMKINVHYFVYNLFYIHSYTIQMVPLQKYSSKQSSPISNGPIKVPKHNIFYNKCTCNYTLKII